MQEKLALAVGVIVPVVSKTATAVACWLSSLESPWTYAPRTVPCTLFHTCTTTQLAWCDSRVQVCQSKTELCNEERGKKEQRRATKGGSLSLDAMSPWWPETA